MHKRNTWDIVITRRERKRSIALSLGVGKGIHLPGEASNESTSTILLPQAKWTSWQPADGPSDTWTETFWYFPASARDEEKSRRFASWLYSLSYWISSLSPRQRGRGMRVPFVIFLRRQMCKHPLPLPLPLIHSGHTASVCVSSTEHSACSKGKRKREREREKEREGKEVQLRTRRPSWRLIGLSIFSSPSSRCGRLALHNYSGKSESSFSSRDEKNVSSSSSSSSLWAFLFPLRNSGHAVYTFSTFTHLKVPLAVVCIHTFRCPGDINSLGHCSRLSLSLSICVSVFFLSSSSLSLFCNVYVRGTLVSWQVSSRRPVLFCSHFYLTSNNFSLSLSFPLFPSLTHFSLCPLLQVQLLARWNPIFLFAFCVLFLLHLLMHVLSLSLSPNIFSPFLLSSMSCRKSKWRKEVLRKRKRERERERERRRERVSS